MESNTELRAKIYRNMIRILSDRLSDANDMNLRYRKLYESAEKSVGATPVAAEEAGSSAGEEGEPPPEESEEDQAEKQLRMFYELAHLEVDDAQREEDKKSFIQLRKDGYTLADIEYAIKWTVRNIPSVKRFNLVKLSINEAFEDKWSM